MQIHPLVTDTDTLATLCARLGATDSIFVDTEFMREHTYYPELCLVQVAGDGVAFAIDPLADRLDMAPFLELLGRQSLLKVLHAGGQDIEIFVHLTGMVPQPLFDTQVAAMAMGMGEQVSYANLVAHFTGTHIDKGARFTDWARRPLDERQLKYAIGDVTWLAGLFPKMLSKLRESGRGAWLDEEMARLADLSHYRPDPDTMWQRLKLPNRKPEVLGRLKALARWREAEAASKNVPRGRIVKDETLADLAAAPPDDQQGLGRVRGLSAAWKVNSIGARLMDVLRQAPPLPEAELPARERAHGLSSDAALVANLLKLLLKIRCKESGVAPKLIAHADELEALAGGARDGLPLLEGWRRQLFGEDALQLVEGRIGFSVERGKLRMRSLEADRPDAVPAEAEAPLPAAGGDGRQKARRAPPAHAAD